MGLAYAHVVPALSGLSHDCKIATISAHAFKIEAENYLASFDKGKKGYSKPTALSRLQQRNKDIGL